MDTKDNQGFEKQRIVTVVRVRPVSLEELQSGSRTIVSSDDNIENGIVIIDPSAFRFDKLRQEQKIYERQFRYDSVCFSLDNHPKYSSQDDVYFICGKPLVSHCLDGFNCSLIAYGQTGSGKTYTMLGTTENPGVIPKLCQDLLLTIEDLLKTDTESTSLRSISSSSSVTMPMSDQRIVTSKSIVSDAIISASFYEIYNEKVYDLLSSNTDIPCRVREHPIDGAYVEGITIRRISSCNDVLEILEEGHRKRSTAFTLVNASSSRSHAIFTIHVEQQLIDSSQISSDTNVSILSSKISPTNANNSTTNNSNDSINHFNSSSSMKIRVNSLLNNNNNSNSTKFQPTTPSELEKRRISSRNLNDLMTSNCSSNAMIIKRISKINLVDLAGSERVSLTGVSGQQLTEANNINKSLSTLGDVIKALSESSSKKDIHIPYRNSILTYLLKESLSGNSKSTMLAAISPMETSYQETMSTLRYIERVKSITTNVTRNDSMSDANVIVSLNRQIRELKQELESSYEEQNRLEYDINMKDKRILDYEKLILDQSNPKPSYSVSTSLHSSSYLPSSSSSFSTIPYRYLDTEFKRVESIGKTYSNREYDNSNNKSMLTNDKESNVEAILTTNLQIIKEYFDRTVPSEDVKVGGSKNNTTNSFMHPVPLHIRQALARLLEEFDLMKESQNLSLQNISYSKDLDYDRLSQRYDQLQKSYQDSCQLHQQRDLQDKDAEERYHELYISYQSLDRIRTQLELEIQDEQLKSNRVEVEKDRYKIMLNMKLEEISCLKDELCEKDEQLKVLTTQNTESKISQLESHIHDLESKLSCSFNLSNTSSNNTNPNTIRMLPSRNLSSRMSPLNSNMNSIEISSLSSSPSPTLNVRKKMISDTSPLLINTNMSSNSNNSPVLSPTKRLQIEYGMLEMNNVLNDKSINTNDMVEKLKKEIEVAYALKDTLVKDMDMLSQIHDLKVKELEGINQQSSTRVEFLISECNRLQSLLLSSNESKSSILSETEYNQLNQRNNELQQQILSISSSLVDVTDKYTSSVQMLDKTQIELDEVRHNLEVLTLNSKDLYDLKMESEKHGLLFENYRQEKESIEKQKNEMMEGMQKTLSDMEMKRVSDKNKMAAMELEITNSKVIISTILNEKTILEERISALTSSLEESSNKFIDEETNLMTLRQQYDQLHSQYEEMVKVYKELDENKSIVAKDINDQIKSYHKEKESIEKENNESVDSLEKTISDIQSKQDQQSLDSYESEVINLKAQIASLTNEKIEQQQNITVLSTSLTDITEKYKGGSQAFHRLKGKYNEVKTQLDQLTEKYKELEEVRVKTSVEGNERLESYQRQLESMENDKNEMINKLKQKIQEMESEATTMKNTFQQSIEDKDKKFMKLETLYSTSQKQITKLTGNITELNKDMNAMKRFHSEAIVQASNDVKLEISSHYEEMIAVIKTDHENDKETLSKNYENKLIQLSIKMNEEKIRQITGFERLLDTIASNMSALDSYLDSDDEDSISLKSIDETIKCIKDLNLDSDSSIPKIISYTEKIDKVQQLFGNRLQMLVMNIKERELSIKGKEQNLRDMEQSLWGKEKILKDQQKLLDDKNLLYEQNVSAHQNLLDMKVKPNDSNHSIDTDSEHSNSTNMSRNNNNNTNSSNNNINNSSTNSSNTTNNATNANRSKSTTMESIDATGTMGNHINVGNSSSSSSINSSDFRDYDSDTIHQALIDIKVQLAEKQLAYDELFYNYRQMENLVCDLKLELAHVQSQIVTISPVATKSRRPSLFSFASSDSDK